MKKINIYTDLALEERERFKRNIEISGVKIDKNYNKELFMTTTDVEIFNEMAAKSMGKPIGSYVTMETRLFKEDDLERQNIFAKEIANHMEDMTKNQNIKKILIVGLGNSKATPDSLGPKVAEQIEILPNVYCLAPGVLAQTGMETFSIVKGITAQMKPDIIIAIDSLAARNVRRITTTIQLTDTGITPGSGIGNHRKGLNEQSLNTKVIAIGVPMVVSGATIVNDTMEKLLEILASHNQNNSISNIFKDYTSDEKYQLFEELLSEDTEQMFVTPKDIDEIVDNLSKIIACGINMFCNVLK